jgi:dihydropteroate synthase
VHKAFLNLHNTTNNNISPLIMGILNVTPDSFSDGGKFTKTDAALQQVEQMIAHGAKIIDIGGESTRPGAAEVIEADEINRVIPILKAIKQRFDVAVSIDTSKASVMKEAVNYGADMINDVRALQNKGCIEAVAQSEALVCLMHMQGQPRTMQDNPKYDDVVEDIKTFLSERVESCINAGINKERIVLDPGFGFGKTLEQNYELLARMDEFSTMSLPVLAGISRKSMIGNLLQRPVEQRLAGSLATAIIAAQKGAKIIRVHDVKETVDALTILHTVSIAEAK